MSELRFFVGAGLAAKANLEQGNVLVVDTRTFVVEKVVEVERFRKAVIRNT